MKTEYHATLEPGSYYHLYNKAVSERKTFLKDSDYIRFLKKFQQYFSPYLDTIAYCLIPNHFHFLVHIKEITDTTSKYLQKEKTNASTKYLAGEFTFNDFLTDQLRRFISSHSLYINNKHHINGPLFLKKIKRIKIKNRERLINLLCYIHHNPIHHGITNEYKNWQYTSYNDYIKNPGKDNNKIIPNLSNDYIPIKDSENFNKIHEDYKKNFTTSVINDFIE